MSTSTQGRAGTPGPDRWIRHEVLGTGKGVMNNNALGAGVTVANATDYKALVVCAGASRGRLRFKCSVGGTLKWEFVRPTNSQLIEVYGANNPANVTVTANVETMIESSSIAGEAQVLLTFTSAGAGTISICDWSAL